MLMGVQGQLYPLTVKICFPTDRGNSMLMLVAKKLPISSQICWWPARRWTEGHQEGGGMQLTRDYRVEPYITLQYTTLHYTTLHYTTLHYPTLHYTTLH